MRVISGWAVLAALALTGCGEPEPAAGTTSVEAQATAAATVARPDTLGVSFEHAPGLILAPCEAETPSCVSVADPAATGEDGALFRVQVVDGALEAVAREQAGFERDAAGRLMTTYGRFEPVPVETFGGPGRQGLRAVVTCGISDAETGFHAAAGECLWAVVSDGSRTAVITSNGLPAGLGAAETALASLQFLSRQE